MPSNPTLFQRISRIFSLSLRTIFIIIWLITISALIWYREDLAASALADLSGLPLGYLEPLSVAWWSRWQWIGADQLAFITVFFIWLFAWLFRSVPVMQGILFSHGMVLLMIILNWLIYRSDDWLLLILAVLLFFVLYLIRARMIVVLLLTLGVLLLAGIRYSNLYPDPRHVSQQEFDVAKRQAVLRMSREEWPENNHLQPYDCEPYDATDPPLSSNLLHISRTLHVNIVRCETSSWREPGAILIWKDMFGTHTTFIFGAPWKVFQEYYMTLGLPTSQPRIGLNSGIVQDFGVTMRIMYEPKKDDEDFSVAWIQQRYITLLNVLPNILCIELLHFPNDLSCWQPTEPEGNSVFYSRQSMPTPYPENWLENAEHGIPLGGSWAPLNPWKALFMTEMMTLLFIMLIALRQSLMSMWITFGCMGKLVMFSAIFGLAIFTIVLTSTYAYSNPSLILTQLEVPAKENFYFQGAGGWNPMNSLAEFMIAWFDQFVFLLKKSNTQGIIWLLRALWGTFGLIMGLVFMPMWVGLAIGGPIGGWIGLFVLGGMAMAVGSFAPLKKFGNFAGQWFE